MAVSSLESIAEKLAEAKKQKLEEILSVSGSNAMAKSEYGITNVTDDNIASTLVFKPLNRNKYDNEQILKSLNPQISELKPDIPVQRKDFVPKPIYDEEVKTNEDLRSQINTLNNTIDGLNDRISELESQVESEVNNRLSIEQSNDVLNNQTQTLTGTVEDFANQIQSSIQKSVEESILRGSLQSQNIGYRAQIEALIKQIDSLNSMIEGLQSQLGAVQQQQAIQQSTSNLAAAANGDAINDVLIVTGIKDGISCRINNKNGDSKWGAGATGADLTNNDTQPITVTFEILNPPGQDWLKTGQSFPITLQPQENKRIGFWICSGCCDYGKRDRSTGYDGKLKIKVKRWDGAEKTKDYPTYVRIEHPKAYKK